MAVFHNSFTLKNTDLRWYRDKYLMMAFAITLIAGISLMWPTIGSHQELGRGAKFLIAAGLCLALSPQRRFILAGALGYIATRGMVGLFLYRSVGAFVFGFAAAVLLYCLIRFGHANFTFNYKVNDYSCAELAIDTLVLGGALMLYSKLS